MSRAPRTPSESAPELLEHLLDAEPTTWLRRVPGRETFPWTQPDRPQPDWPQPDWPQPDWIVKRFEGDAWRERIADLARRRSPAAREHDNLLALAAAGLPVPRPVGVLERGRRSLLAMERVPHTETLDQRLARVPRRARRPLLRRLAELTARLHSAGWFHRDLYLVHWILRESTHELVLLDVGRARHRRRPRRRWFVKDLAALASSAPPTITERERRAFLLRYLAERNRCSDEAPAWSRRIESKRAAILRHEPRHDAASRRWSTA